MSPKSAIETKALEQLLLRGIPESRARAVVTELHAARGLFFGPDGALKVKVNDDRVWEIALRVAPELIDVDSISNATDAGKARRAQAREARLRRSLGMGTSKGIDANGYDRSDPPEPEAA